MILDDPFRSIHPQSSECLGRWSVAAPAGMKGPWPSLLAFWGLGFRI